MERRLLVEREIEGEIKQEGAVSSEGPVKPKRRQSTQVSSQGDYSLSSQYSQQHRPLAGSGSEGALQGKTRRASMLGEAPTPTTAHPNFLDQHPMADLKRKREQGEAFGPTG